MIFKGLKFGMLLQLSVGPMCLLVFKTAGSSGFSFALALVGAIALVDLLYITLAILGVTSILKKPKIQMAVNLFGSLILLVFGANIILSVFNINLLPTLNLFSQINVSNIFFQGILLTASNPLTILFWGGVFSTKAIDEKMSSIQLVQFGIGCVLATILFLTTIALVGNLVGIFLPVAVLNVLNIVVGVVIIAFGIKMLLKSRAIAKLN